MNSLYLGRRFLLYMDNLSSGLLVATKHHIIINLLSRFPGRHYEIPRDRLYSLRYIASDAAQMPVDYDMSKEELLFTSCIHVGYQCLSALWPQSLETWVT